MSSPDGGEPKSVLDIPTDGTFVETMREYCRAVSESLERILTVANGDARLPMSTTFAALYMMWSSTKGHPAVQEEIYKWDMRSQQLLSMLGRYVQSKENPTPK